MVNDPLERYKSSGTLILIPKIEDYIKYTYQVLVKIPRVEKFNIGSEIKTSSLRMLEYAHYLNKDRQNAYSYLNKIDALISYNRSMVRILNDEKSITKKNYETCISKLAEIGRMVGGLIKIQMLESRQMNRIIISGRIKSIDYRLVDKGKVYAISFIELQNEKSKENLQVIAKNGMADLIYRKFEIESNILIEGYIQKTRKNLMVIIRSVEKLENGEMDKK